jgi:hypothetical protein
MVRSSFEIQNVRAINWSSGGAFVLSQNPLPIQCEVILVAKDSVRGRVIRHSSDEKNPGMAIAFNVSELKY